MNQKGKVFSLIAVSGAMLFSFAIIGKNFDFLGVRADNLNTTVEDVIDFDGSKINVKEVDGNYVSRSKTKQGDYVYLVNKSLDIAKPSTGNVATFVKSSESGDFVSSIEFARDSHNSDAYIFQNIYQINVITGSSISNIHLEISDDGENYRQYRTFDSDHYEESSGSFYYTGSVSIDSEGEDCSFRLVQDVESKGSLNQNFKRIVLSYTCNNNYTPLPKYTVSANNSEHGSIVLGDRTKYKSGQTVSFEVNPEQGYEVESLTLNPSVQYTRNENIYSFVMPSSDVQISAVFGAIEYEVTAAESDFGSILLDETGYNAGETVEFMVFPAEGYEIVSVSTDPVLLINENDGLYSFVMPYSDVEISANYKEVKYSVSTSCEHGAISLDETEYAPDDIVEFEITTDPGYEVDEVTLSTGGEVIEVDDIYMFEMPSEDVVIIVSFNEVTPVYRVSVSGDEHCTVDYDDIDYDEGDEVIFTIDDIDQYYVLENVQTSPACTITEVDGFYSFDMPASNVQIIVTLGEYHNLLLDNINNGTIILDSPALSGSTKVGTDVEFHIEADESYSVEDVFIVDHDEVIISSEERSGVVYYSFEMPNFDSTITATLEYVEVKHNVSVKSLSNGTITYSGAQSVVVGSTVYFDVSAKNTDYSVKEAYLTSHRDVIITYDSSRPTGKYSFVMPDYDVEINATVSTAVPVSLEMSGYKKDFCSGDPFTSSGISITCVYDSGKRTVLPSSEVTNYVTITGPDDMTTVRDNVEVSLAYEYQNKKYVYGNYYINIKQKSVDVFSGTYICNQNSSYKLVFDENGTGYYDYSNGYARINFEFTVSGTSIFIFNGVSVAEDFSNNWFLFENGSTENNTVTITGDTSISFKTYGTFGSSNRTGAKQTS